MRKVPRPDLVYQRCFKRLVPRAQIRALFTVQNFVGAMAKKRERKEKKNLIPFRAPPKNKSQN